MRDQKLFLLSALISCVPLMLSGCGGSTDLSPKDGQEAPLGREETRKTNFGKLQCN